MSNARKAGNEYPVNYPVGLGSDKKLLDANLKQKAVKVASMLEKKGLDVIFLVQRVQGDKEMSASIKVQKSEKLTTEQTQRIINDTISKVYGNRGNITISIDYQGVITATIGPSYRA